MARRRPRTTAPSASIPRPTPVAELEADDEAYFAWLGERLRRVALGLTVALVTMRVYWPSEPDTREGAGGGLYWVLGLLIATIVALAAGFVSGRPRPRWSWTDAAVIALISLVGLSARHAADVRPAYNLAWEWVGLGLAYLLVRNLPRTRGESSALAGALVASAFAVAAYGLYQVGVELSEIRALYKANPQRVLQQLGIAPGSASQIAFQHRLLHSNEPWSTFALANSLAGYIVGPLIVVLAVIWENVTQRDDGTCRRPLAWALDLVAPIALLLLGCLVLTKSRSAYVGFAAALVVLAWNSRHRVRTRTLGLAAGLAIVVLGVVVMAAWATGRFDHGVLTESLKSLRYRGEYWVGAWRLIVSQPGVLWRGLGPGNFGWAYVRFKLPESSEEIADPHNMLLEVWATAGVFALLALVAALGLGLWNLFAPPRALNVEPDETRVQPRLPTRPSAEPPVRPLWIVACAGGGLAFLIFWSVVVRFEVDLLARWAVIGVAWLLAVVCGRPLWSRRAIPVAGLGAGALAIAVNLLAAGGIGITAVALMLWTLVALGLNLREDRTCGRPREVEGRVTIFALAAAWAALAGLFYGTVVPYWKADGYLADAESALRAKPPNYAAARQALMTACEADEYSPRPYLQLAAMELDAWKARGGLPNDTMYLAVSIAMHKAVSPPRNPNSWSLQRDCAAADRELLALLKGALRPVQEIRIRGDAVQAARKATLLYPTNANLRALLAETSAEIGKLDDAVTEGEEALRLDRLTPHEDKKLPGAVRERLERQLPVWRKGVPNNG
ncbi:MAG: O-antigen ligase family protein [Isosphaeraceae bacterium]|nr:O-antigen ligase family protein [Isosphaeraceae bacterium]